MTTTKIDKGIIGNIGLFLTCVELSKMNLITLPTIRNTKGLDLFVLHPKTNKSVGVQVKCSDQKEYPVFSSFWYNYEESIRRKIISPFVFVDISTLEKPAYFILSKDEITVMLQTVIKDYIDLYTKKKNVTVDDIHNKEKSKNKNADLWALKRGQIEKYCDKWASMTDLIE
jgi:hypothetical protein